MSSRSPRRRRSPACRKAPSRYNPIVNPQLATRAAPTCCGACASSATSTPRPPKPPTRSRSRPAPTRRCSMSKRRTWRRWRACRCAAVRPDGRNRRLQGLHDHRRAAADGRQPRRALGLIEYDRRHGWRGPVGHVDLAARRDAGPARGAGRRVRAGRQSAPAVVVAVGDRTRAGVCQGARLRRRSTGTACPGRARRWRNGRSGPPPRTPPRSSRAATSSTWSPTRRATRSWRRCRRRRARWSHSIPNDGAIAALVGGFDYFANKYNRAIQARRLPGSGFKPFLYSAALENGFTPASTLLDAPVVLEDNGIEELLATGERTGQFSGPMRLREALVHSRNLVSIRLLRDMGMPYAISTSAASASTQDRAAEPDSGARHAAGDTAADGRRLFGFRQRRLQGDPYYMERVEDASGKAIWQAAPRIACALCGTPASLGDLKPARRRPCPSRGGGCAARRPGRAAARPARAAGHQPAERLADDLHDEGRHQVRHRRARALAESQ